MRMVCWLLKKSRTASKVFKLSCSILRKSCCLTASTRTWTESWPSRNGLKSCSRLWTSSATTLPLWRTLTLAILSYSRSKSLTCSTRSDVWPQRSKWCAKLAVKSFSLQRSKRSMRERYWVTKSWRSSVRLRSPDTAKRKRGGRLTTNWSLAPRPEERLKQSMSNCWRLKSR